MLNIGDRYTNKFGEQFEIIKKTSSGYLIKFDNGVLKATREKYILSKGVHSPYAKTLLGVGYLGDGKYNSKEKVIKEVADYYKNKYPKFPQNLYDALYAYEVEITD